MKRILQNKAATLRFVVTDSDGVAADATGTPTVSVRNGAGTEIQAGNATKPAGTGIYEFVVTSADTATLDELVATLTYVRAGNTETMTQHYLIVGAFFFTLGEARAFDGNKLSDVNKFPTDTVVAARDLVESEIEDACGVAFVPQARRLTLDGSGVRDLVVPDPYVRSIVAASISGTVISPLSSIAIYGDESRLFYDAAWAVDERNVVLHYTHGYDAPPERIKRAALILLIHRLFPSSIDDRAIRFTDELGTRDLAVAGRRGQPFGIPEVDAAVNAYKERVPIAG